MKKNIYLLLFAAIPFIFAQCGTIGKAKMADKNRETIRIWYEEGWNHNKNDELIERCFSPNWRDGNPLSPHETEGLEGMRELVKSYRKAFPDAKFTITHLFATESSAAIRYEVTATHLAEMFGMPPTGKEFSSTGIVLYEMENGKIKSSWQELDLMGIFNQLRE